jgi:plasmid stabilization system protein ParE
LAQIEFTAEALRDLDRLFDFLAERDPGEAMAHQYAIRSAIEILSAHPQIGRPMSGRIRELVISIGKTGYLAMYSFRPQRDEVRVLAVRHQRELDYPA